MGSKCQKCFFSKFLGTNLPFYNPKWTASKIQKDIKPEETKTLSPSVVVAFVRKYKIKLRRVQRRKQKPKSDGVALMQKWHMELREGLIKTG